MKNTIRNIQIALSITMAAGIFIACQKESSSGNGCKTDMEHIAGTYKLTAMKYKVKTTSPEQDYLRYMDACETDNLITLSVKGSYTYSDAGVKCSPDEGSTGTWSVKGNTITCEEDDILDLGVISDFDCKQLVLYHDDVIVQGDRMIFTLVKQ